LPYKAPPFFLDKSVITILVIGIPSAIIKKHYYIFKVAYNRKKHNSFLKNPSYYYRKTFQNFKKL